MDRDPVRQAFDAIYSNDPRLGHIYAEAIASRTTLLAAVNQDMEHAAQGAPGPQGFRDDARRAARMMLADPHLRLVFFQLGGWDTHVNQGAGRGQLANHLRPLGEGLATFHATLGPLWRDTVVLVISEFGRTAHENGDRGTDHGHGNVHWLMGGPIAGGRVYGKWSGLGESELYQARDLPVTTDFRSLIDIILTAHMGADTHARHHVLPGFLPDHHHLSGLFV